MTAQAELKHVREIRMYNSKIYIEYIYIYIYTTTGARGGAVVEALREIDSRWCQNFSWT
jgi:hypothetical protein